MISNIFKPAWQHDLSKKRLAAIEKFVDDDAETEKICSSIIDDDSDAEVRLAALKKLSNPQSLFHYSKSHPSERTQQDAKQCFCLLIRSETTLSETHQKQLSAEIPDANQWIAANTPYLDLRTSLLSQINDLEIAHLIGEAPLSEIRVSFANSINEKEALELARRILKGKDKNAEKILKLKIDTINEDERIKKANKNVVDELCEKMELLAAIEDWRVETKTQFAVLSQRWQNIEFEVSSDCQQRFKTAQQKVEADIEQYTSIANSYSRQEQLTVQLEQHCVEIGSYKLDQVISNQPAIAAALNDCSQEWSSQGHIAPHKLDVSERFIETAKSLEGLLELISAINGARENLNKNTPAEIKSSISIMGKSIERLRWPRKLESPNFIDEAKGELREHEKHLNRIREAHSEKISSLHKKLNRIINISQKGNLQRSRQELEKAKIFIDKLNPNDKRAFEEKFEKAEKAIIKIADWKDFATEPKLVELCEQMEQLAKNEKINADAQAKKIKALQDSWKSIGDADICDKYWPRFKLAADTAYEPCSMAFKERRETQKQNLKKRQPLIISLKQLLQNTDWESSPDYYSIERKLVQLDGDWRKIKNVEQKGGQKQWKEFSALKDSIYDKLKPEYERNIELKHALIEQLNNMSTGLIDDSSLAKLQFIQGKWKQIGITRRQQDQKAWKKFKRASDLVYAQIQEGRKAVRDAENEQISQFRNINSEISKLSKTCTNLAEGDHQFEQLQQQYQALPSLPRELAEKVQASLEKDHSRACAAYEKCRDKIIRAKENKSFELIVKLARLCSELEALPETTEPSAIDSLEAKIKEVEVTDKKIAKRLRQRMALARSADRSEHTQARHSLCIEMEILADIESPKEDQPKRTNIQLSKLQNIGIGQNHSNPKQELRRMNIDWLCLPGAEPIVQAQLEKRVTVVLKAMKIH